MPPRKKTTELMQGITNPFSPEFLETWNLWKDYKKDVFKFSYKGVYSEQVKLMQIYELSDKNEEIAKAMIMQAIGNQWCGIYSLKNTKPTKNGQADFKQAGKTIEFDRP